METLALIAAFYGAVTGLTFAVQFARFVRRRDLRGRSILDEIDPTDGFVAFVLMVFVAFFGLALANPVRFAHLVIKVAFWPITTAVWLYLRFSPESEPTSPTAPRMPDTFFADVLVREGFPATPHNVFALQERLGILFTTKARQFMEGLGDENDWRGFLECARYPRTAAEMPSWPQRVLDALVAWDSDIAPHLQDFPTRYVDVLLEGKGDGSGFFGGPADVPLPTANREWHMKGIAQPDAVPVPPPAAPHVPAPRRAPIPASRPWVASDEPPTEPIHLTPHDVVVPARSTATGAPRGPAAAYRDAMARPTTVTLAPAARRPTAPARPAPPVPPSTTGRHARR